jgi:MscS family membrane protein
MDPSLPLDLSLLLFGGLLTLGSWGGLLLLARLAPSGSLLRRLLVRARLSVGLTLLVGTLVWWLFVRFGWDLSRNGTEVRQVVLTLGLVWTVLRCKGTLLTHAAEHPGWWLRRSATDRAFLLDVLNKLITAAVVLLAVLEVLRLLGVSLTVLVTASGFGAAALGFGARTLVENLLGGVMLYLHRPFVIGDFIQLPAQALEGVVQEIGLYYTQLITPDRQPLYVPNATFATTAILNGARRDHRQVLLSFGLRHDDQPLLDAVIGDLRRELERLEGVDAALPRRVHFVGYGESSLDLRLECYSSGSLDAYFDLQQELLQRIGRVVEQRGASMPFPTRVLLGSAVATAGPAQAPVDARSVPPEALSSE